MKIMHVILIIVACSFFAGNGWCNDMSQVQSLFYQGNTRYGEGKFQEAIIDYEKALESDYESGALYYNLGNAYFKKGSLGKAILNYLRARRIMPDDADVKSNLQYAQSLIKGGVIASESRWLARIFTRFADLFSLNGITVVSMILYWAFSIIVILFIVLRNARKICVYVGTPLLIVLIVCIALFIIQFRSTAIQKQAVVITETADAKFEPFEDATTFFALYEGESIVVVTSKNAWIKAKRLDGKQGWIKKADIEIL